MLTSASLRTLIFVRVCRVCSPQKLKVYVSGKENHKERLKSRTVYCTRRIGAIFPFRTTTPVTVTARQLETVRQETATHLDVIERAQDVNFLVSQDYSRPGRILDRVPRLPVLSGNTPDSTAAVHHQASGTQAPNRHMST